MSLELPIYHTTSRTALKMGPGGWDYLFPVFGGAGGGGLEPEALGGGLGVRGGGGGVDGREVVGVCGGVDARD
jgi:hypothetical protein